MTRDNRRPQRLPKRRPLGWPPNPVNPLWKSSWLPVVMLSASAQEEDIVTAYRLGANAFLCKPSEARRFEEMVQAIKDFWLTHNTLPDDFSSEAPLEGVVTLGHSSAADCAPPPPGCRDGAAGSMG